MQCKEDINWGEKGHVLYKNFSKARERGGDS